MSKVSRVSRLSRDAPSAFFCLAMSLFLCVFVPLNHHSGAAPGRAGLGTRWLASAPAAPPAGRRHRGARAASPGVGTRSDARPLLHDVEVIDLEDDVEPHMDSVEVFEVESDAEVVDVED